MLNLDQYRTTYKAFKEALHNEYTTCLTVAYRQDWLEGEALAEHQKHFNAWIEKVIRKCQTEDIDKREAFYTTATPSGLKRLDSKEKEYIFYIHKAGSVYYRITDDIYMVDAGSYVMFFRRDEVIPFNSTNREDYL